MTRRIARFLLCALLMSVASPAAASDGPGTASAPLPKGLENLQSSDPYQRELAFLRLEAQRDPASAPIIRRFISDKDSGTRAYAARALAAVEGQAAAATLRERLHQERDARVRRALLLALEPLRQFEPDLLDDFIASLKDHDAEVRMAAVDIVSRVDDPRANEALRLRKRREGNRDVRRVLKTALLRLGPKT